MKIWDSIKKDTISDRYRRKWRNKSKLHKNIFSTNIEEILHSKIVMLINVQNP